MPIYDFAHEETGEIHSASMPWKDKDAYMKKHNVRSIFLTAPTFMRSSGDLYSNTNDDFKAKMKGLKSHYPTKGPNQAKGLNNW